MTRRFGIVAWATALLLLVPGVAAAAWIAGGGGSGAAAADAVPAGPTPAVSVSGLDVTVTWAAVTFADGVDVGGYLVARYAADTGIPDTVLPGCSGVIGVLSCTESSAPQGIWRYGITPVRGGWSGAESDWSATVTVDTTAPVVSAGAIGKTAGGLTGSIPQGGTYYVYAQVTDAVSSVSTVTADVSTATRGSTAVPLVAGSYTAGGTTYNHRSASLTADSPLSAGSKAFTITATDSAANTGSTGGFSVTVDNTRPTGFDVQTANASGGAVGHAETDDTVTLTYSEAMEPISVLAGWTGASTTVTVRLIQNGAADRLRIWNAGNTAQLPFGTILLSRTDYVTSTVMFTGSTMTLSGGVVTITLGTPSGAVGTAAGAGTMLWQVSTTPTDVAGNACQSGIIGESGGADPEF